MVTMVTNLILIKKDCNTFTKLLESLKFDKHYPKERENKTL